MNTHFKIAHQDDIRRFSCQPDFATLETTTKTVLSLPATTQILFKYVDEDKDLCTISSSAELACAISYLPSPIRLQVVVQQEATSPATFVEGAQISREQVIQRKLTHIKELLQKPDLPIHRAENLNFRRERLESDLEALRTGQHPNPKPGFSPEMHALRSTIDEKRTQLHEARQKGATQSQIEALVQELVDARLAMKAARNGGRLQTQNPQFASLDQEIAVLKDIVATKRMTLQQAKKSGTPKAQLEVLLQDLVDSRNDLVAKKATKRDSMAHWRSQAQEPANITPEVLQANLIAKRTAFQEAKKNGAPQPELNALKAELVLARNALKDAPKQDAPASPLHADLIAKRTAFQQAKKNGAPQPQLDALKAELVAARNALKAPKQGPKQDAPVSPLQADLIAKRTAFQEAKKTGAPQPQLDALKAELVAARKALNTQNALNARNSLNGQEQTAEPATPAVHKQDAPASPLHADLIAKRTAFQQAKKNGAPQPQLDALKAELVLARTALNASKGKPEPSPLQVDLIAKRTAFQEAKKNGAPKPQLEALKSELALARAALIAAKQNAKADSEFSPLQAELVAKRTAFQEAKKNGAPKPQLDALKAELIAARAALNAKRSLKTAA